MRWLVPASLAAFAVSTALPVGLGLTALCGAPDVGARLAQLRLGFASGLVVPWALVPGWMIMTAAMMLPLTSAGCARVLHAVAPALRRRAVSSYLAGYLIVWLLPGIALALAGLAFGPAAEQRGMALIGCAFALGWSASPIAQRARNAMHRAQPIRGFGPAALLDSGRFGATSAVSCILSCWPWMLVPFLFGDAHRLAMAAITLYLFLDRLEPPSPPRWRLPPAIAAARSFLAAPARLGDGPAPVRARLRKRGW